MADQQEQQIQETQVPLAVTTISTIAIQAGEAKIVLAILRSRQWVRVRVQEMTPFMVEVGHNLQEALRLRQQHQDLLQQLTAKQQQINSLLTQADTLIASQQAYNEVYEAMAESLGEAWKDLNAQLEDRRTLLDQSVAFHQSAQEFSERMDAALEEFSSVAVAQDIPTAKSLLQKHQELKKSILEASMHTLNKGQALLDRIKEVGNQMDPRYQHATTAACYGIERVMEELHDRRRLLEELWLRRKLKLEQCLLLCELGIEVEDISKWFKTRGEDYMKKTDLGDSLEATEKLIKEHIAFEEDAREIQINVQRLLRAADKVASTGAEDTEQVQEQTKAIETLCETFVHKLELRRKLLQMTAAFYQNADSAMSHLNQIELQLQRKDVPEDSPELVEKHSRLERAIDEISAPVLREGHLLLERVSSGVPSDRGVGAVMANLEAKVSQLKASCTAHKKAEAKAKSSLYVQFEERYSVLLMWMLNVGEAFLSSHRELGTQLSNVNDFLEEHEQLEEDIRDKDEEVEAVLESVTKLVKSGDQESQAVQDKAQKMKQQWTKLTITVEARIKIALTLVEFHKVAKQLSNAMDIVEEILRSTEGQDLQNIPEATVTHWTQKWKEMTELFAIFETKANTFLSEAKLIREDPDLNIQRAVSQVETMLKDFRERKASLSDSFDSWQIRLTAGRDFKTQWEQFIRDARKTIEWIMNTEAEFFPQIAGELGSSVDESHERQHKLSEFEKTVQKINKEIEERVKTAEMLALKGDTHGEKDLIVNELVKVHQRFQARLNEYQILLTMTISFYESVAKLTKLMEKAEIEFKRTELPTHVSEASILLEKHDKSKDELSDLFRTTFSIGSEIVTRVRQYDPVLAAKQGVDSVLQQTETRKQQWLQDWRAHRDRLQQHMQLTDFEIEKQKVVGIIQSTKKDLDTLKGQYGDSVHTVTLFVEKFDRWLMSIKPVKEVYDNFVSSAQIMLRDKHPASDEIKKDLENLEKFWNELSIEIEDHSKKLQISVEYHELLEQVGPEQSYALLREKYTGADVGGVPYISQQQPEKTTLQDIVPREWQPEEFPPEQEPLSKEERQELAQEQIPEEYRIKEVYQVPEYSPAPVEVDMKRYSPMEVPTEEPKEFRADESFKVSQLPTSPLSWVDHKEPEVPQEEQVKEFVTEDVYSMPTVETTPLEWDVHSYKPQEMQMSDVPVEYQTNEPYRMPTVQTKPLDWNLDLYKQQVPQKYKPVKFTPRMNQTSPVVEDVKPMEEVPLEEEPQEYRAAKTHVIPVHPTSPLEWAADKTRPEETPKLEDRPEYFTEKTYSMPTVPTTPLEWKVDIPDPYEPKEIELPPDFQTQKTYAMPTAPRTQLPVAWPVDSPRQEERPKVAEPVEYAKRKTYPMPTAPVTQVPVDWPVDSSSQKERPKVAEPVEYAKRKTYPLPTAPVTQVPVDWPVDSPSQEERPKVAEPVEYAKRKTYPMPTVPTTPLDWKVLHPKPEKTPIEKIPEEFQRKETYEMPTIPTKPLQLDTDSGKPRDVRKSPSPVSPLHTFPREYPLVAKGPVPVSHARPVEREVPKPKPVKQNNKKPEPTPPEPVDVREPVPQEYRVEETVTIPIMQPVYITRDLPDLGPDEEDDSPPETSVEESVEIPIMSTIQLPVDREAPSPEPDDSPKRTPPEKPVVETVTIPVKPMKRDPGSPRRGSPGPPSDQEERVETITEVTEITHIRRPDPKPVSKVSFYQAPPVQKVKPQKPSPKHPESDYVVAKYLIMEKPPDERHVNSLHMDVEEFPDIIVNLIRLPEEPYVLVILEQSPVPLLPQFQVGKPKSPQPQSPHPHPQPQSPPSPQQPVRPQVSIAPQPQRQQSPPQNHQSPPPPPNPTKAHVTVVPQPDGQDIFVPKQPNTGSVFEQFYSMETLQQDDGHTIVGQKRLYVEKRAHYVE